MDTLNYSPSEKEEMVATLTNLRTELDKYDQQRRNDVEFMIRLLETKDFQKAQENRQCLSYRKCRDPLECRFVHLFGSLSQSSDSLEEEKKEIQRIENAHRLELDIDRDFLNSLSKTAQLQKSWGDKFASQARAAGLELFLKMHRLPSQK